MEPKSVVTTTAPTCCPACHSVNVTTTSKTITAETYWRCSRCGEVWNVGRRENGSQGYRRGWR